MCVFLGLCRKTIPIDTTCGYRTTIFCFISDGRIRDRYSDRWIRDRYFRLEGSAEIMVTQLLRRERFHFFLFGLSIKISSFGDNSLNKYFLLLHVFHFNIFLVMKLSKLLFLTRIKDEFSYDKTEQI